MPERKPVNGIESESSVEWVGGPRRLPMLEVVAIGEPTGMIAIRHGLKTGRCGFRRLR
jgi:hypothetical protein